MVYSEAERDINQTCHPKKMKNKIKATVEITDTYDGKRIIPGFGGKKSQPGREGAWFVPRKKRWAGKTPGAGNRIAQTQLSCALRESAKSCLLCRNKTVGANT